MSPPVEWTRSGPGGFLGVFRYGGRALELVWSTSRPLTLTLAALTVVAGVLPAGMAYTGKLIIDGIVTAAASGLEADRFLALQYIGLELLLTIALTGAERGLDVSTELLRAQLGYRVNEMILVKASKLSLTQFEDSEFYDKLTRARREASRRPLSLVRSTFRLVQRAVSLASYGALIWQFSPVAALIVVVAGLPAFVIEAKYSGEAFQLFRWRSPDARMQMYLETVLAREDYAKEVKLFSLAPVLLARYRGIFDKLFAEDRSLTLRRGFWGYLLGLLGTVAFYGTYGWIGWATITGDITLGDMAMYLVVFKQGQQSVTSILSTMGGMYEDNLYLSTLYEFLHQEVPEAGGTETSGPEPGDGVRFEGVSFHYPGAKTPAVDAVDLHLRPGEKLALVGDNGAGKTTLIKLLTRLYEPSAGRITLDGRDLREWDAEALQRRIGVIFQDFARYQLIVGENVGAGDVDRFDDEPGWARAGERGMAAEFVDTLDSGYRTQLGRWFKDGTELSGGQWQKIALSRLFMRENADILVLDEPTAAMDAEAEYNVFQQFRSLTPDQMAIIISHRFSTVRMADTIVVLEQGRVTERGSHEELMRSDGRYAKLFGLQAEGYR